MKPVIKLLCRGCRSKLDLSELEPFSKVACPICGTGLRVPMAFGELLLEKPCGSGGMSVIYRAIDRDRTRRVAVKIMQREYLHEDPLGTRYINAKNMVCNIAHPGIIPIYETGVCEELPFLTMMYMDKGTLKELLRREDIPFQQYCHWMATVTEALAAAQKLQIVHHDLKPANIMFSGSGEVRLGDFDLADIREKGDMRPVENNWGTPDYASPERLSCGGEDHRGDIFSLGMTLYELLAGQLPFASAEKDPEILLELRRTQNFTPLYEIRRDIPFELSILVTRMLRYLPENRPEYDEIIRVLQKHACAS